MPGKDGRPKMLHDPDIEIDQDAVHEPPQMSVPPA